MDHNLEGGAVEIVVNPNLSSGVIGNRLEGSLNLDRNIVVTADDDGRLTASTIQPEGSAFCLVCDNLIKDRRNVDVRHLFIADSVTLHTQQQVGTLLAHVLNVNHLDHEEVYSDVLCRRCGRLLDELDEVEQRSIVIRNKIQDWYNKSVLRRLKNPNDPSIEAYDDLDLSEDEAVTSVIKVKSAPVESDLDDDPLLDELRPEDQGIRADDPEFNPFYDVQRRQRGRGRGRGGRSRGRGRGRGRGRVGRPPKYGVTKYPPVSSTGSIVSAGEKFGQLVTKILGDEETSPMDTDIETEKGEVATNTDQQTEKISDAEELSFVGGKKYKKNPYHFVHVVEDMDKLPAKSEKILKSKKYICDICDLVFENSQEYKIHQKNHGGYECGICFKVVAKQGMLKQHYARYHGLEIASNVQHVCWICGKKYQSKQALNYHVRTAHDEKKLKCSFCDKVFGHLKNLKAHLKRHGEKEVVCDKCPAKFFTTSELGYHYNALHQNARCWKCEICDKEFSRSSTYFSHINKHKQKTFECTVCFKMFRRKAHIEAHMKQHFQIGSANVMSKVKKYHSCNDCCALFDTEELKNNHLCSDQVKVIKQFFCNGCNCSYQSKAEFENHVCIKFPHTIPVQMESVEDVQIYAEPENLETAPIDLFADELETCFVVLSENEMSSIKS